MCLAIYKPAGLDIPEKNLKSGFDSNNDGCGLAWAENGELHVEKGMLTWDAFFGLYKEHSQCPMLIHFRKSTHGKKDENNCHPFLFNDGKLALIHNGVIPIKCSDDGFSDTWHFTHKVLEPMVKQYGVPIDDQALSWFIRVSIGTDKVAVMDNKGEVVIFNEDKGNWEDTDGPDGKKGKVWYSNYSFRYSSTNYASRNTTWSPNANQNTNVSGAHRVDPDNENEDWEGYGYHPGRLSEAEHTPLSGGVDTQIADDKTRGPGKMTEYGWYDNEIEEEISDVQTRTGMSREDAIIDVFNNA